jgi:Zn-dependent protease
VLWALGQPVAFAGLLIAFLFGVALRAVAIRLMMRILGLAPRREPLSLRPREDIDPFGAVVAALGGTGWGRAIDIDEVPRHRGRGRAALVYAAGPLSAFVIAQIAFAAYVALFPVSSQVALVFYPSSAVLRGAPEVSAGAQFLLSFAVGLLCFALLSLIPSPPLDGFGLLHSAFRQPGAGFQWARLWLSEKNLGVALLLLFALFPTGYPILLMLIDLVGTPLMGMWA